MIAPVSAPQVPQVRDMPPQNEVATLGRISDSIPWALASASTTLSAQYRPEVKESSADLRTFATNSSDFIIGNSFDERV
jgi:hypothetical protein